MHCRIRRLEEPCLGVCSTLVHHGREGAGDHQEERCGKRGKKIPAFCKGWARRPKQWTSDLRSTHGMVDAERSKVHNNLKNQEGVDDMAAACGA